MTNCEVTHPRRVVLGVTSAVSLRLLEGFPDYLAKEGWEVHVVCDSPPASTARVRFHAIPMAREPRLAADLLALVRWLWLLRHLRPTLVVAGTPKAGMLGTVAAWLTRVPVRVYMLRGLRLETEKGAKRRILWLMERLSASTASHVQAVSASLRSAYLSLSLTHDRKIFVLGAGSSNGVDTEIRTAPKDAVSTTVTVGFVGRVTPDKGLSVLLTAMDELHRHGVKLLVVGGEEPLGYWAECLKQHRIPADAVRWMGHVANPGPLIDSMDLLFLPSKREGFPNVVLEAAARSVPSVVTRVTGCVDAVVDGETGWIVPADDPRAVVDTILAILLEPSQLRAAGDAARERAVRDFDRRTVWNRQREFYELALKESGLDLGDELAPTSSRGGERD